MFWSDCQGSHPKINNSEHGCHNSRAELSPKKEVSIMSPQQRPPATGLTTK